MSNELDQATGGGLGLAFILSELRDLRKGMETRDENLRGSIDSVRDSVNLLSAKVDRSQGDVDKVQIDLRAIREDLGSVRNDVDEMRDARKTDLIVQQSAWAGPVRILRNLALIGAGIGGLITVINFWPIIVGFFPVEAP
jgi:hypothetical protein